jgi:hypothetical protein
MRSVAARRTARRARRRDRERHLHKPRLLNARPRLTPTGWPLLFHDTHSRGPRAFAPPYGHTTAAVVRNGRAASDGPRARQRHRQGVPQLIECKWFPVAVSRLPRPRRSGSPMAGRSHIVPPPSRGLKNVGRRAHDRVSRYSRHTR